MRKLIIGLASCLCALISATGMASMESDFETILNEHWGRAQQEQIFFRTDPDAYRPDGKLAEVSAVAIVIPAEGPSLGMAPSGTWM